MWARKTTQYATKEFIQAVVPRLLLLVFVVIVVKKSLNLQSNTLSTQTHKHTRTHTHSSTALHTFTHKREHITPIAPTPDRTTNETQKKTHLPYTHTATAKYHSDWAPPHPASQSRSNPLHTHILRYKPFSCAWCYNNV